jgi:hypothetical protein
MRFTVTCIGSDPLGLRETLERFANEQWLPTHATREEAAEIVVDQFRRTIAQALAGMAGRNLTGCAGSLLRRPMQNGRENAAGLPDRVTVTKHIVQPGMGWIRSESMRGMARRIGSGYCGHAVTINRPELCGPTAA